ncbi:MAG: PmoA family protein [Marinilabiliales bacterium]|nr:PmoA family protein [Marinilabiliales bacterium]
MMRTLQNRWNTGRRWLLMGMAIMGSLQSFSAKITAQKSGDKIQVLIDGKFFTSYIFSDQEKYPYFFPVNGPLSGGSVTSLRNAEYPHHSSLFFGCDQVNGGNYWQEGLERGIISSYNAEIIKEGGDSVVISDECIWHRPGAEAPIRDVRRYIITAPSHEIRLIDVTLELHMLCNVVIRKTNHSLFSVRMASDLAVVNGGTMINAEGNLGEKATFGKSSPWMDYFGKRGNGIEGIAILQHPKNPMFPDQWFTRDYGFFSPTSLFWPIDGEKTELNKGDVVRLRYRVVVHAGDTQQAGIDALFKSYREE